MKKSIQLFSILLVLSFLTFSENSFAQEKNNIAPAEKKSNNSNAPIKNERQVQYTGPSFQLDENDQFQGRKQEFLSQIILKQLPSDFPKYEKWMGVRHYNEIIEEYYKKHLDIVNEGIKNKLQSK